MIKQPTIEIDNKHNRIWLRLELGSHGEANHFIDALLIAGQKNQDQNVITFCVELKANERFYKGQLMTYFSEERLNDFVHALGSYVSMTDPYTNEDESGKVVNREEMYRGNPNATTIDVDASDINEGQSNDGVDEADGETVEDDSQVDNM